MARLTVLDAGFYTTIQDLGRIESRCYGVPHSGAMDQLSSRFVNTLLNNLDHLPVIEMTLTGATFLFSEPTMVAIAGANCEVHISNQVYNSPCVIGVKTGDVLEIAAAQDGNFIYLGILGGFQVEKYLNSASYYPYFLENALLKKGSALEYKSSQDAVQINAHQLQYHRSLKAYPGPEFHSLSRIQQERLLSQSFTVSKNWNRMAFQLLELIENDLEPINSSPVLPGTVQLTPEGSLIILMRDAQTTGGYPRVLQLREDSISTLSQYKIGTEMGFFIN